MIIISDPTGREITSTYVTDLATDGSAELDPDGLQTPSSATDTISLLAIPPTSLKRRAALTGLSLHAYKPRAHVSQSRYQH